MYQLVYVCHESVSLSPAPPTEPSTSVDTGVVIGVVVAIVIVILLIILAVFIIVLFCMRHRDTSESQDRERTERRGIHSVVLDLVEAHGYGF